jgi:hypothetical protein
MKDIINFIKYLIFTSKLEVKIVFAIFTFLSISTFFNQDTEKLDSEGYLIFGLFFFIVFVLHVFALRYYSIPLIIIGIAVLSLMSVGSIIMYLILSTYISIIVLLYKEYKNIL